MQKSAKMEVDQHPTKVVDLHKFEAVLKHMHSRLVPEEIWRVYDNWQDIYKEKRLRELTLEECITMSQVIGVKSARLTNIRNEIIYFMRNHQQFYNDDVQVMCQRLREALNQANERAGRECPVLNWLPEFGGLVQDPMAARSAETKWRKKEQMGYAMLPPGSEGT